MPKSENINLYIGQQLHKIWVRRQLTKQSGVNPSAFQQLNHIVTQTQVLPADPYHWDNKAVAAILGAWNTWGIR